MKERMAKIIMVGVIVGIYKFLYAPENALKNSKEGGQIQWVSGQRGWNEDGTYLWTAVSPLPLYSGIGIGTSSPLYKLHVVGDIYATGNLRLGPGAWPITVTSAPTVGYVLKWNGSAFVPQPDAGITQCEWTDQGSYLTPTDLSAGDVRVYEDATSANILAIQTNATYVAIAGGYSGGPFGQLGAQSYGIFGSSGGIAGAFGILAQGGNAPVFIPPAGHDVAGIGTGKYWGWYGIATRQTDVGVGVVGLGDSLTTVTWMNGAGVVGCSKENYGTGIYGYNASGAGIWGESQQTMAGGWAAGVVGEGSASNAVGVLAVGNALTGAVYINGAGICATGAVGVIGAWNAQSGDVGVLGYSDTRVNYFYHNEDPADGDNQSAVYGYRTRTAQNDGTSYAHGYTNQAIHGANYWGDVYTFGVTGHNWNDFTRCGGVLGADWLGTYWGSLGYKASNNIGYGGYFTSTGSGGGFKNGIGFGSYGNLMGGWVRGEEYGLYATGKRYAAYFDGNEYVKGYVATIHEENNKVNVLYALTGTSINVMTFGKGKLSNGDAVINFDVTFRSVVSDEEPIIVIVTPIGKCEQIYVSEVSTHGFSAHTSGKYDNEFYYIAIGKRKGYEDVKIPEEILTADFDDNMLKVAFNENNLNEKALGMYYDNSLKFGTPPELPIAKKMEETPPLKVSTISHLQEKKKIKLEEVMAQLEEIEGKAKALRRKIENIRKTLEK